MRINRKICLLDGLLGEEVSVLLLRGVVEHGWGPELGGEESIRLREGVVHSHRQVTSGTGVSSGG